uniref:Uncharacterized protein n=1 Tax=Picea sitchensis TaxID=3332 RepID=A9NXV0_PICSI|nr:unknown [Picea sitchensis]
MSLWKKDTWTLNVIFMGWFVCFVSFRFDREVLGQRGSNLPSFQRNQQNIRENRFSTISLSILAPRF